MFCNIQWGYTQEVLLGSSYSPREVIGYLRRQTDWPTGSACYSDSVINANIRIKGPDGYNDPGVETSGACLKAQKEGLEKVPHIDENGSVSTQRYRDYMSNCIESDKPIIDEFNWGENQYGSQSAAYCALNPEEIFRYFRLFVFDTNILDADQKSIDDTLGGAPNALVANNTGSGGSSGGVFTPSGTVQQLAQNLLACSNATLSTGTWLSSGVSPLQQVTNMANGLPAIPGYSYSVNPKILQVLVAMCQKYKFTITSLVRTTMTADGVSVHPYGLAVDIGSIGSNGLETLDATYRAFLIDAQSLFQEMNTRNTFGVYPSLKNSVEQFITYSYVFSDAGTGAHLHIGLPKIEMLTP
ncbi:hypothetical protein EOM57_04615 [Candidatus Saccharibacteria bacterium]|nr:hypothetical protein [Candidatus Saccharibacteria bacterium]